MCKNGFRFLFQDNAVSEQHTKILRGLEEWTLNDAHEHHFSFHLLEIYFTHLMRTDLPASAELLEALDLIRVERKNSESSQRNHETRGVRDEHAMQQPDR